jgi:flagellar motor switch/type III secretory pathway protein FliN
VSTSPDPDRPPSQTLEAAVTAVTGAVTLARLTAGALATGEDAPDRPPTGLTVVLALSLTGRLEGTVTLAVNDELADRLEYAATASGPAEALAPVAAALVAALARSGAVDATPLVEVEADAWPAGPGVSTAVLTMAPEGDADESEEPEPGLALAFALTVVPVAEDDLTDGSVTGRGQSALSTSAPAGITSYVPSANRPGGVPLTAEGRRLGAVEVDVAGVLGETTVALHELLTWLPGVIVSLHRDVGMPVDVRIDDATVAHAEIVVVDERYALRVLDVVARVQARVAADRTSDMRGDSSP